MSNEPEAIQMANRILANNDRANRLIDAIPVNRANFEHIAKSGVINGSLNNSLHNMLTDLMTENYHQNKAVIAEKDNRIKELEAEVAELKKNQTTITVKKHNPKIHLD